MASYDAVNGKLLVFDFVRFVTCTLVVVVLVPCCTHFELSPVATRIFSSPKLHMRRRLSILLQ